jgi:CHAD domain-containing protein
MELDYVKLREVKPSLAGYLNEAYSLIKSANVPSENTVHDVRVLMKKARAVLRLTAPQLDPEFIRREYTALREVGRIMSSWRETSVLRKALKELKKKNPTVFSKLENNEKINLLMQKKETLPEPSNQTIASVNQLSEILHKSSYRLRFEPLGNLDPQLLLKELEMTYNRVVNNYMISRLNPTRPNLHKLRKTSKDFLYQLWFFRPLNSSVIKVLEKRLDLMTQNLGKYNDLAELKREIDYKYEYLANNPSLDELVIIIKEEQDKYLLKIWPVAYKIFCPGQKLVNVLGFKLLVI